MLTEEKVNELNKLFDLPFSEVSEGKSVPIEEHAQFADELETKLLGND